MPGVHLDLSFTRPDLGRATAVELKYLTRAWTGVVDGEQYELKDHEAQDIRAYDAVKDIARVEKFTADRDGADGAVIVLANDPSYWRPVKAYDTSNAAAFRISEGVVLSGRRAWGANTGAGTMKGRVEPLELTGAHELRWKDYSRLPGGARGSELRRLTVEIGTSNTGR